MNQREILNNIIMTVPRGVAYLELIYDQEGQVVDAHIIGVNEIFKNILAI